MILSIPPLIICVQWGDRTEFAAIDANVSVPVRSRTVQIRRSHLIPLVGDMASVNLAKVVFQRCYFLAT